MENPDRTSSRFFTLNGAVRAIEDRFPDLWKKLHNKHIEMPGTHYPYNAVCVAMSSGIIEPFLRKSNFLVNFPAVTSLMARHDYPTYVVSKPLLEAMINTRPPEGFTWNDLVWPYDAMAFVLPRGGLYEPKLPDTNSRTEIAVLFVGKVRAQEKLDIPGWRTEPITWDAGHRILVSYCLGPDCCLLQNLTFPLDHPLEPHPDWIDRNTKETQEKYSEAVDLDSMPPGEFTSVIAGLCANFLLLMQARADLHEPSHKLPRTLKNGLRVHEPHYLGRHYVSIKRERIAQTTGAHFTELGWRGRHYKSQPCGKDGKERKIILVEPYIAFSKNLVK